MVHTCWHSSRRPAVLCAALTSSLRIAVHKSVAVVSATSRQGSSRALSAQLVLLELFVNLTPAITGLSHVDCLCAAIAFIYYLRHGDYVFIFILRASCGAVYCNRSRLWVCVWVCYHDNSKLRESIFTKLGL